MRPAGCAPTGRPYRPRFPGSTPAAVRPRSRSSSPRRTGTTADPTRTWTTAGGGPRRPPEVVPRVASGGCLGQLRELLLTQPEACHRHQRGQLFDGTRGGDGRGDGRPGGQPGEGDRGDLGVVLLGDPVERGEHLAAALGLQVLAGALGPRALDGRPRPVLAGEEARGEREVRDRGKTGGGRRVLEGALVGVARDEVVVRLQRDVAGQALA